MPQIKLPSSQKETKMGFDPDDEIFNSCRDNWDISKWNEYKNNELPLSWWSFTLVKERDRLESGGNYEMESLELIYQSFMPLTWKALHRLSNELVSRISIHCIVYKYHLYLQLEENECIAWKTSKCVRWRVDPRPLKRKRRGKEKGVSWKRRERQIMTRTVVTWVPNNRNWLISLPCWRYTFVWNLIWGLTLCHCKVVWNEKLNNKTLIIVHFSFAYSFSTFSPLQRFGLSRHYQIKPWQFWVII